VDIVETMAVTQPGLGAVTLVQEGEPGADREALVAHRGKYEHFIQRQRFGKQPVEPHIGEQAAGKSELARAGTFEPVAYRLEREIFRDLLDRRRDGLAIVALAEAKKFLAHRGPVAEVRFDQAALVVEAELRGHLARELRLAVGREPGELSL